MFNNPRWWLIRNSSVHGELVSKSDLCVSPRAYWLEILTLGGLLAEIVHLGETPHDVMVTRSTYITELQADGFLKIFRKNF